MLTFSVAHCTSYTSANDGALLASCPTNDLIFTEVEVPEFADYQAAFITLDLDVVEVMFGAMLMLFVVGLGVGWMIRLLKSRL